MKLTNDRGIFGISIEIILRLMFSIAGVDYNTFEFTEDWYLKHEWSKDQESRFKEVFLLLLKNNANIRKDICGSSGFKNKDYLEKVFNMFNLNYGWKLKDA